MHEPEMDSVSVEVDGKTVQVPVGSTILAAARAAGAFVPTLCHLEGTSAIGSCRLCSVEVEGRDGFSTACNTPVVDGMVVRTDTSRVRDWRRIALELIVADLNVDAVDDDARALFESSQLAGLCRAHGVKIASSAEEDPLVDRAIPQRRAKRPVRDENPFYTFNPNLCIRCQRCVGACNTVAHNGVLQTAKLGSRTVIEAPFGPDWKATICENCGMCIASCPTSALSDKRARAWAKNPRSAKRVLTTCPHCGVGCQLRLVVKDGVVVGAEGADGPSNKGRLCIKGRQASFDFVSAPDRLRAPLVKNPATGAFEETSWDEALDLVARRFSELRDEYGGSSLAAFACSRSTNEDIYLFQKMARAAFKTNNVDNCARV